MHNFVALPSARNHRLGLEEIIIVIASHLQSNSVSVDVNGSLDFFFKVRVSISIL